MGRDDVGLLVVVVLLAGLAAAAGCVLAWAPVERPHIDTLRVEAPARCPCACPVEMDGGRP